jgi:hypothetical protein
MLQASLCHTACVAHANMAGALGACLTRFILCIIDVERSTSTTATVAFATAAHDQHAAADCLTAAHLLQVPGQTASNFGEGTQQCGQPLSKASYLQAAAHQSCMSACMIIVPRMHGMLH